MTTTCKDWCGTVSPAELPHGHGECWMECFYGKWHCFCSTVCRGAGLVGRLALHPVSKPPGEPVPREIEPTQVDAGHRSRHRIGYVSSSACFYCTAKAGEECRDEPDRRPGSALPLPGPPDDGKLPDWAKRHIRAATAKAVELRDENAALSRDLAAARTALVEAQRDAEWAEFWRIGHGRWREWADGIVTKAELDANGNGDAPVRESIAARITALEARLAVTVGALEHTPCIATCAECRERIAADVAAARAALAPTGAPPAKEPA